MKTRPKFVIGLAVVFSLAVTSAAFSQEKKAKPAKVSGDIGLLDTEKNYMIVVTKDGKLVTVDFNQKTKVTALRPSAAKMADIGLGSAASVQYVQKNGKNYITAIEYTSKK